MKAYITFVLILANTFFSYAQDSINRLQVSELLLKHHVYALASDSLKGRRTGAEGQLKAAVYCAETFRNNFLSPIFQLDSASRTYLQYYFFTATPVQMFGNQLMSGDRMPYLKNELLQPLKNGKLPKDALVGHNVGGVLLGTDLKRELIVISAHYDHLGTSSGGLYYGADDNASGTASVLAIAALFDSLARHGIRPRRSIAFVLFSGEEGGLTGSNYFVENSPLPLSNVVCNLNIDMVGRIDPSYRKKQKNYCFIIGAKIYEGLGKIVEEANLASVNMKLDLAHDSKRNPSSHFYSSDHYNFARKNIPILFFFDGVHEDYHRPTDTANKIEYDVLQQRATLVFQTAWIVANQ